MTDVQKTDATPKTHRRRRANAGGFRLKLEAPQREGFVRRWVDDNPSRVSEMHELGYDFVQDKAAGKDEARTDGLGSRMTRMAGKRDDGTPHQLVLMETPVSEFAVGKAEKEERLKPFEEALKAGADTTGRLTDAYTPRDGSSISHQRV